LNYTRPDSLEGEARAFPERGF